MKKIWAVAVMLSASMLSGCLSQDVMKQMSADCAKVGGAMQVGVGLFGPSMECVMPEKD